MAVVRYKCDICSREIDLVRNPHGLETFGRCTITDGCRGKLHQQEIFGTRIVGRLPPDVEQLNNWVARRVLFKYEQTVLSKDWTIEHKLGTTPSVQIHIKNLLGEYEEITPLSIDVVDRNTVRVSFPEPTKGIAQCIAISTDVTIDAVITTDNGTVDQLSTNRQLLIMPIGTAAVSNIDTVFLSSSTGDEIGRIALTDVTPIASTYKTLYKGKQYQYFYASIGSVGELSSIPNGSSCYFDMTNLPPGVDEVFILLTKPPHDDFNILQLNKILEMSAVGSSSQTMLYTDGELYVNDSQYVDIYPSLRRFVL